MKKLLLIMSLLFATSGMYAQKYLTAITLQEGDEVQRGVLAYDSEGRVTKYTVTEKDETVVFTCSYGNGQFQIKENDETVPYVISLENGLISLVTMEEEGFVINTSYSYENGYLKEAKVTDGMGMGLIDQTSYYTWENGNLVKAEMVYQSMTGEQIIDRAMPTYNQLQGHPVLHAMFGLSGGDSFELEDLFAIFTMYPYMGEMPKNLFEKVIYEEENGKETTVYTYSYETDAAGDIVKVTVNDGEELMVYTFEWAGNPSNIDGMVASDGDDGAVYNLNGQRIGQPRRGLYIKNGRKVVVR